MRCEMAWGRWDGAVSVCSAADIGALTANAEADELFARSVKSFETSSVRVDISGISKQARQRSKNPLKRRIENSPRVAFMEINSLSHYRYKKCHQESMFKKLAVVTAGGAEKAASGRRRSRPKRRRNSCLRAARK